MAWFWPRPAKLKIIFGILTGARKCRSESMTEGDQVAAIVLLKVKKEDSTYPACMRFELLHPMDPDRKYLGKQDIP